jgi:hypothetical protein
MLSNLSQLLLTVLMEDFLDTLHEVHGEILWLESDTRELFEGYLLWGDSLGFV